jgi:ketosteroid isomerase-like protein
VYHAFIRHQVRKSFAALGTIPPADEAGNLAPDVEHVFAGASAIGGARHGPAAFVRWLERVYCLLPDLKFNVQDIIVSGGPFNTRVAVHWRSRATSITGDPYANDGVHLIRMSKGKITSIRVFTDTDVIVRVMEAIAAGGVAEAVAAPSLEPQSIGNPGHSAPHPLNQQGQCSVPIDQEKTHFFVMGITGKIGYATAEYLLAHGKEVRALVRNREKAAIPNHRMVGSKLAAPTAYRAKL